MSSLLIVLHVLAAVLFLGPVTVAVSGFAPAALAASRGDHTAQGRAHTMYKITQTYGLLSLCVPLIGFALMFTGDDYWSQWRYNVSMLLTVVAWGLLFFVIVPRQRRMIAALGLLDASEVDESDAKAPGIHNWSKAKSQLAMFSGIFALTWVIIFVLMMV